MKNFHVHKPLLLVLHKSSKKKKIYGGMCLTKKILMIGE